MMQNLGVILRGVSLSIIDVLPRHQPVQPL